ncbi:MAG: FAD-dependent oxidoreductase [Nitrospiraceae bacterium]|nr:FAD-dependent oxidoreductase [Nitrospiraceae bacterium]
MERFDIIIIGAGISGLSLAHYCGRSGMKTAVLEKTGRPGGALCSHRTEGFWFELGAHTCYNSYSALIGIIEEAGIRDRMIGREKVSFKMLVDNEVKSIPSQLRFHELFASAPRIFSLKKEGRSMESYYGRIVGMGNFDRVFAPAFNAVISQDARDFPAEMLFKKRRRRKDIMKKFTFDGGLQTITDSIAAEENIRFIAGADISSVAYDGKVFSVSSANAADYESEALAVAAPAFEAARLLQGPFPDVAAKLGTIRTEAVESMGVMVRKDAVTLPPFAGLIPVKDKFFSIVSRDTVRHPTFRGFTFHFKPDVMDRDAKLRKISAVLKTPLQALEGIAEKKNFIPSLRVGHGSIVGDIDRLLQGKPLFLAGNYFDGVAMEDCVSRSLSEFQRLKKG